MWVFWVALHLALMLTISSTEGLPWDPAIPRTISERLMQRKEWVKGAWRDAMYRNLTKRRRWYKAVRSSCLSY